MKRSMWGWIALAIAALVVSAVLAAVNRTNSTPLDPHNAEATGAEAIATVLGEQGVRVQTVDSPGALDAAKVDADTSVLISLPEEISGQRLADLARTVRGAARLIIVEPDPAQLEIAFGFEPTIAPYNTKAARNCDLAWGQGLSMDSAAVDYGRLPEDATTCFAATASASGTGDGASAGGAGAFEVPATADRPAVLVLGSANALANKPIRNGDNAAIGLRALGQDQRLVWYSGGYDPAAHTPSPWPRWIRPTVWLLLVVAVLVMFWRGRRLGRLVTEPLPVVVPADETTRARGQLYRRSRDTARAGEFLRAATTKRLRTALGLPPTAAPEAVAHAVARQRGEDPVAVTALLTGPPVTDEDALTRLANDLRTLERQVQHR